MTVELRVSRVPVLDEAVSVTLRVRAERSAPGTSARIALPSGARVLSGSTTRQLDLAAGQSRDVAVTVRLTEPGKQKIEGTALRRVSGAETWGDVDQLFFTVGEARSTTGYEASTGALAAQALPGTAVEPGVSARVAGTFSVCWQYANRQGGRTPLRDVLVQLRDDDTATADDLLRQAHTGAGGCVNFPGINTADADEGGVIDPYLQFLTQHAGLYRVETYAGALYTCTTSVQANASAGHNFGTWYCGGTSGDGRALAVYDDLYLMRRFIMEHAVNQGYGVAPANCTVRWQTGGTDGTYYLPSDGKVHLSDANARSRDTVVHECAHRQMHVLYGGFPATDCPSPHYITGVSGKVCAWTEGWTYATVAGVDGNPVYTFDSGATVNLETANCKTADFAGGSKVEGRVGGTLIDLMDPFTLSYGTVSGFSNETSPCGGNDTVSGQYGRIWDLVSDQNDVVFIAQEGQGDSFSRAWRARGSVGYPLDPAWNVGKVNAIGLFTRD